ncbi:MAG TPA: nitrite reductase large subunit NirB, partial [Nitriliruptorales bacterium]
TAPTSPTAPRMTIVVVGNGMVGQHLLGCLVANGVAETHAIVAFGEEPRAAYDRVALSSYFAGRSAEDLSLATPEVIGHPSVDLRVGVRIARIDRDRNVAVADTGEEVAYDALVLATGSFPFVPPVGDAEGPGSFVYRTIEDLDAIRACAAGARSGVVIGGGLLGLEAANALRQLGLTTHVVEFAPQLMPAQIDAGGGAALRRRIEELGIAIHTDRATRCIRRHPTTREVVGLEFADDQTLDADMVVYSAGIRPRDELARQCGLDVGERGGVVVDDRCLTADPHIYAIGEVALHEGRIYGLVAPGYAMARVVADRLAGGRATFTGADTSTKLKLLGVDVASFGDAHGTTPDARTVVWDDTVSATYNKLVLSPDGTRLLGGVLVGDAEAYALLHALHLDGAALPDEPAALIAPARAGGVALGPAALPEAATICSCNNVTKATIRGAVNEDGCHTVGAIKARTRAATSCGSCESLCKAILEHELEAAGVEVDRSLCEHFAHTRQELFDIVRVRDIATFAPLLEGWGTGRGCAICKPAVASMLATHANAHVLDDEHVGLQDTNDRFLANLQRDGSYSVIPRVPGGEITPEKLIVLGEIARDFDLYTKITGGQRIDLLGARIDQLPHIWERLVAAGFESGHAYGKALRTVKSCVGQTWCRYGVQDSTALAIALEERYRGLRSPHKLKSAVSGCARECAEAQSKDVGVIATEKGWNLYVCGNGGMRPRHATLFAEDLDTQTLVTYIDRFLMYYCRTADRLERTSVWFEKLEGGIDHLRRVVVDDALDICDELDAAMQRHVDSYQCEWAATLADPRKLARFTHFVNDDEPDPDLAYVRERDQRRPAYDHERPLLPLLVDGGPA